MTDKSDILDAIRAAAQELGEPLPRSKFLSHSGMPEYQVLKHFPSWKAALKAAGIQSDNTNVRLDDGELLQDWGKMVRRNREIPTRDHYRRSGNFGVNSFANHFGPWSSIPEHFRRYATGKPEWTDVIALLPQPPSQSPETSPMPPGVVDSEPSPMAADIPQYTKLSSRQVYGNPIDFRGLRHEPINENGVIFLFGIVAKELGYYVEAVQAGFPDCEAKRQVAAGKWQRVRIEFEYLSKNFRDHGHAPDGCDVIVCWRHNWPDCPTHIEILELERVITQLSKSDD
ncbi:homing endonuclease associated repeat-containing protein [Candidatus Neomarinimicrobiota bacterium]